MHYSVLFVKCFKGRPQADLTGCEIIVILILCLESKNVWEIVVLTTGSHDDLVGCSKKSCVEVYKHLQYCQG